MRTLPLFGAVITTPLHSSKMTHSNTTQCAEVPLSYITEKCIFCLKVRVYEEDSLTHCGMMKPGWMASMMDSMSLLAQSLTKITLPVLLIHGASDPVVSYSSSEFVYKNLSSEDKAFLVRPITLMMHAYTVEPH